MAVRLKLKRACVVVADHVPATGAIELLPEKCVGQKKLLLADSAAIGVKKCRVAGRNYSFE